MNLVGGMQYKNIFQFNIYPEETTTVINEVPVARPKHICQKHSDQSIYWWKVVGYVLDMLVSACFAKTRSLAQRFSVQSDFTVMHQLKSWSLITKRHSNIFFI